MGSTLDLHILWRRAHYQALQSQKILAVPTESDCLSLLLTLQERLPPLPRLPLIGFRRELFTTSQSNYSSYLASDLSNGNWQDGNGNILNSWREAGTSKTGTDALY